MGADSFPALEPAGLSLYVHIPFCKSFCTYCDFPRVRHDPAVAHAVLRRMQEIAGNAPVFLRELPVFTVFFGGGTPSAPAPGDIAALLQVIRDVFAVVPDAEISIEANPEDVDGFWLEAMLEAGFTRFSFGIQSLVHAHPLGRRHTPAKAVRVLAEARAAGVSNVNIDMIFALPDESIQDLRRDLEAVIALQPDHMSGYALTLAPGTPLYSDIQKERWRLPSEEEWIQMYECIQEEMQKAGYEHYEISNWARPGWRCRHNGRIWEGGDYIGLGPAAASRFREWRWKDPFGPQAFLETAHPGAWRDPGPPPWAVDAETVDGMGKDMETLLTGIRLLDGLDVRRLHGRLDDACICSLLSDGLLWQTETRIGPTRRGLSLSDTVLSRLVRGLTPRRP